MHARVKETYRIGSRIPLQRMSDVFRNPSKSCVRPTNGREMCLPLEIEEQRRCRRSASNPVDRLLLHQKLRNNRNLRTHIAAVDDFIHLTVLQQEFGTLLLRHVNHRISAYLKAVYPDATWEWRSPEPEKLILHGGTGRITISGIPDYNQAEVTFDQKANFSCSLLKVTPVVQSTAENGASEKLPAPPREIDPQVWFEQQGRKVLDDLIYDLNSRGYSSLVIKDNGDVCIRQGDVEKAQTSFKNLPEKHYWPRLLKVFEREGIAASMTDDAIALNW